MTLVFQSDAPVGSEDWKAESVASSIYTPIAVFLLATPACVVNKLWSRYSSGGILGWDDFLNVLALLFAVATDAVLLGAVSSGYGRHLEALSKEQQLETLKFFWVSQITYKTSINLTKASLLLLYLRIFGGIRLMRWACFSLLAIVGSYWIACMAATIFQCDPIQRSWDTRVDGECINNRKFWYANAGFSIATDIIIFFLPTIPVMRLNIPKQHKIGLMLVFALGLFVVITSCLRITTIDIQATGRDRTFDVASTMWTVIEMNVAIICSCLPQFRPLVVKLFSRLGLSRFFRSQDGETKDPPPVPPNTKAPVVTTVGEKTFVERTLIGNTQLDKKSLENESEPTEVKRFSRFSQLSNNFKIESV